MEIINMPKLESPFVREKNEQGQFVVINKIAEGYEWVFEDENVLAIEKLHGMNISIYIDKGEITHIWTKGRRHKMFGDLNNLIVSRALLNSYERGYLEFLPDGQHFGEVIGKGIQSNEYDLEEPLWIPFSTYAKENLYYKSWGKYQKDFDTISEWFKELMPLFNLHRGKGKDSFVEGIVFTHPDGRMAKLRVDMFDWYKGKRHKK